MDKLELMQQQLNKANGMLVGLILKKPEILYEYTIDKKSLSEEAMFYVGITQKLLEKGNEVIDEVGFSSEVENIGLIELYNTIGISIIYNRHHIFYCLIATVFLIQFY